MIDGNTTTPTIIRSYFLQSEYLQDDLVSVDKFKVHVDKNVECPDESLIHILFQIVSSSLQRLSRRPSSIRVYTYWTEVNLITNSCIIM